MQRFLFEPVQAAALDAAGTQSFDVVLDVGCGTGKLLASALQRWPRAHATGVDPAFGMATRAAATLPSAVIVVAQAEHLPLPDASVDLALSTISLHHWHDRDRGIAEVARVLRPGGRFVLADLLLAPWVARLAGDEPYWDEGARERAFDRAGLVVGGHRAMRSRGTLLTVGVKP